MWYHLPVENLEIHSEGENLGGSVHVVANWQPLCFGQAGSALSQMILQVMKLVVKKEMTVL